MTIQDSKVTAPDLTAEIFTPANLSCPHATWAKLRDQCPVPRVNLPGPDAGTYLITRKADIEFVASHPEIFASEVSPDVWRWGSDLGPDFADIFADGGYTPIHTVVTSDPPRAHKYRMIALEALAPARVKKRAGDLQKIVDDLIAPMPEGEVFDFRAAFTVPVPLQAIISVFGLPLEDSEFIYDFTCAHLSMVDPITPLETARDNARLFVAAQKYLIEKLDQYRKAPEVNFLSYIANWRSKEGEALSTEEALSMAFVTLIGGNETTRNALSTAMYVLARDPELWARLDADRDLIPSFCEEIVRFGSPATMTPRQVVQDTVLNGTPMAKGAAVYVLWGSGSHDDTAFDAPGEIQLGRPNGRAHTSFGYGVHHCAGIHFARLEMIMSVGAWLDAFESVELVAPEGGLDYEPAFAIRALPQVPVRVKRRA